MRTLSLAVVALLLLAGSLQGRQPAAAIEELVGRMLAAQEQGDAEAYLAVWSERSPEIEGVRLRARGMASGIFGVQFSGAYLSRLQMDGDFASARLTALLDVVDVRDVHRGDALPRRVRQQELRQHLTFIREANGWRLWADRPAVEVLAGALLGEEDAARRDALLAAEPELATEELARAVAGHGDRWSVAQQWTRAAEAFRLAITLAERAGAEEALSSTLQRLGNALYFQGDLTGAHEHYRRKLEIDTARGDPESVSMAHLGMATVRYSQGAYGAALESYAHHLVIEEELGREEWQASAHGGIANIHYLRGEYPEALAAYRRALGRHLALRSEADVARTWHRLGQVHVAQGDYAGGLAAYERAYAAFERLDDRSGRAIVLEAVGQAQFHQGRHAAALQPYRDAIALHEALGDAEGVARGWLALGLIELTRGEAGAGLEAYERSRAGHVSHEHVEGEARALLGIGFARTSLGRFAEALEAYRAALATFERLGLREETARTLLGLSLAHGGEGGFQAALEAAEGAGRLADALDHDELRWRAELRQGMAHLALEDARAAAAAFERSAAAVEAVRRQPAGPEAGAPAQEGHPAPFLGMVELLAADGRVEDALRWAERARAQTLLDALHRSRTDIVKSMLPDARAAERRLLAELASLRARVTSERRRRRRDDGRLETLAADVQQILEAHASLLARAYEHEPRLRIWRGDSPPVDAATAVSLGSRRHALLQYVITGNRPLVFVLGGAPSPALTVHPIAATPEELAARASRLRSALAGGAIGDWRTPAREVYGLLIEPIETRLEGTTELTVLPDGALWHVPFEALVDAGGRTLLERAAIGYATSLTAFHQARALRDRREDRAWPPTLLGFIDPAIGPEALDRISLVARGAAAPADVLRREAWALAELYGVDRALIHAGPEARVARLRREGGDHRYLQFSSLFVLTPASPMFSFLPLTDRGDADGVLEARDLLQMEWRTEMTVLAGLHVPAAAPGIAEGVAGLVWAFFVAGCPTVAASRWTIDDPAPPNLVVEFHRGLNPAGDRQDEGLSKREALRQAALAVMRTEGFEHPHFWARLMVIGDGR